MEMVINARELRKALSAIEEAEKNGFNYCLVVLKLAAAGPNISQCVVQYSDMIERAHPTDAKLDWGRFQGVTRTCKFKNGKLVLQKQGK
jgi:hypothetical protein